MIKQEVKCIKRYDGNPVLSEKDISFNASLIFNAGVVKIDGKYFMLFRNDYTEPRGSHNLAGTNLGLATSDDGIHWVAEKEHCLSWKDEEVTRIYDPRLHFIEGEIYVCFACDTKHGLRGGIAKTDKTFRKLDILNLSVPDNRNMVLFPEKINGKYVRLERPLTVYSRGGDYFDIWCSESPDMRYWGNSKLVLGAEKVPFSNQKIGPAAPPIKTEKGWLTTFHAVEYDESRGKNGWEKSWKKIYYAGIMLLDLSDPSRVIGMCKQPLISPVEDYERDGFRNDVIFPGGMILEDNGEVKIYYGAADTVECLATASLDDLLALCSEKV